LPTHTYPLSLHDALPILANPAMSERLQAEGWRELSLFVRDPETGVLIRVRYDLLSVSGIAVDIKKCQDARPEEFSKAIFNYAYRSEEHTSELQSRFDLVC